MIVIYNVRQGDYRLESSDPGSKAYGCEGVDAVVPDGDIFTSGCWALREPFRVPECEIDVPDAPPEVDAPAESVLRSWLIK
jgi:hypothetical protein